MTSHLKEPPAIAPDAINEQLERVLTSPLFKGSERSSKLLRFLVVQTVSLRSDRLKEYTLGTEALGKHQSFDPRTDPSVRSEASRLRARLEKYYAAEGRTDAIKIGLPKGSYVPKFESRPDLPVVTPNVPAEQTRPTIRPNASLVLLVGFMIIAAVLFSYWQLTSFRTAQGLASERAAAADPANVISIAVLPFLNLSGDASQQFFSDGMTEEITAALAKVPDLKVVARTSAFRFRGELNDMRTVGQALNATHLIEGSVRKEGDRVRITAQLIEVGKGTHLWSESYDRKLSDIFATQEEIARTIVSSLMAPLGLAPGERLVSNRTIDPESYEQYLRAKALVRARGLTSMTDAAALLEQVVSRNPDYAPGWALLAQAYHFTPTYHPARNKGDIEEYRRVVSASLPKAEAAARRAIQLAPNDADGYSALGYVQQVRGHPNAAEELYSKALASDPNNSDALHLHGLLLAEMGRLKEALSARQKLQALDPFVPVYNAITALVLWLNGQTDSAMALLKDVPAGAGGEGILALIYAQEGRYREAANALPAPSSRLFYPGLTDEAARLLRMAPMDAPSPKTLPRLGLMSWVYLYVGELDRALEFYEGNAEVGFFLGGIVSPLWDASYAPLRKTERFRDYARKSGMVEYWRAKGWPEFCHPTTGDNFVCD